MLRTRLVAGVTSGVVLSAVFASALTVAAFIEAFVEPWRVEPGTPAPVTLRLPRTTLRAYDRETGASRLIAANSRACALLATRKAETGQITIR